MNDSDDDISPLFWLIIFAVSIIIAGFTVHTTYASKPHDLKYIPVHSSAYALTPKKKAYVYESPNRKKKIFTLTKNKVLYIPDKYLVSDDYGGEGEGESGDGVKLGHKDMKFGKKKGLAPIMLMDRFNLEYSKNFGGDLKTRQLWNTRMFIDFKQFKVKHTKKINLYQKGKEHKLAFIDTCDPYVYNAKKNEKDDDDLWWLPIYIYQSQQRTLLNSTDDDNAIKDSDQTESEINRNTTSHPSNQKDEDDDDEEENSNHEDDDDDENTNHSDDDDNETTTNDDEDSVNDSNSDDSFGGGDEETTTETETPTESEGRSVGGEE